MLYIIPMTKKHFELVAEIISSIENRSARVTAASKAIKLFEKENPRFNKDLFLDACNLEM